MFLFFELGLTKCTREPYNTLLKRGELFSSSVFSECNSFEENAAVVCYSCAFKFADLLLADVHYSCTFEFLLYLLQVTLTTDHISRFYLFPSNILYLLFFRIDNCLKCVGKKELIGKDVQFCKQIGFDEIRYNYLKLQGKTYCL